MSKMLSRTLLVALMSSCAALTALQSAGDDDCALYLSGPGRTSAYDYSLNLLKGNFGYEGQHTCITYDAVNQAYLEARKRIVVSTPKGEWKAEDFASVGELILDISINLARRYGLTYEEIEKGLPLIDTSRTLIRDVCPPVFSHVECRAGKYRRFDGLCNNLQNPTWGSTMAPFQRLIGPLFSDGINAPRVGHTGQDLPLSRVVSRTMHPDEGYHDHAGTVMVIAWGQFMDHDYTLTGTPLDPVNRNDPEECCQRPPHLKHPYCNEIRIPDDDYFYRLWGVKCIDFVRAFPSPRPGCRLGSRVPFNTLTGALDGNTVYGVTDKFSRKLRTGYGGLLRMNPVFKEYGLKDLLPLKLDIPDEGCTRPNKNMYCFEGGEIRVNEQLVLTVMHTLMAREHNRVAKALAAVNPHWDDETLFQEARRINVAEIQHITYNEFLPILLGKDVMDKFGLVLEKDGYWDGYDPNVNPDVIDAFASAAFRFGHSLLPTAVERWSKAHKFIASKRLSDLIRRPYDLYRAGVLDEYVMGLMNQVAQAMDDSITQEVTNHLFKKVGARFGMDLVSFNMQRGREFGIPGYMEFRKFCGLAGAETFQDLFGSMPNETVRKYETIFEHPIDVDLWSGGVSERPLPGSMLGPTFACVIATQFSYSRRGDRFWFELPNQPSSFTPEQLHEIRKSRLARVICDNTDIIDTVQLYPMVLPDHELNPRVPCRSGIIPSMDFSKWAEPAPFHGGAKPFITEASIIPKNETEGMVNTTISELTNDTKSGNVTEEVSKIQQHTADAATKLVTNCSAGQNTTGNNCTGNVNINTKTEESQGTDTILKYIYKKDAESNVTQKSSGHPKNSLKKRKRSANNVARAPLIVDYETAHTPHKGPRLERITGNVIRNSDLADFNIETLHDNPPHAKNAENRFKDDSSDNERNEKEESSENQDISEERDRGQKKLDDSEENNEKPILDDERETNEHYRKEKQSDERDENSSAERKPHIEDSVETFIGNKKPSIESYSDGYQSRENHGEDRNNERYKTKDNSRERGENSSQQPTPHSNEESGERKHSSEEGEYRERDHDDNQDNYRKSRKNYIPSNESREKGEHDNSEEHSKNSQERDGSSEKDNSHYKAPYSAPSEDSNEGREHTDESDHPKPNEKQYYSRDNDRQSYIKPREENSGSYENQNYNENTKSNENDSPLVNRPLVNSPLVKDSFERNYKNDDKIKDVHRPSDPNESEEEEATIAIIKKKTRRPYNGPENEPKYPPSKIVPADIKDVDLDDFTHERIHVNDKGLVEPIKEPYEYNNDTPLNAPLPTFKPEKLKNSDEVARPSLDENISYNSESSEENGQPIDDVVEVKPVVEINPDKEESTEDNSKESLKAKPDDDTSLESLLGVKDFSDEKSDKIVAVKDDHPKGDVKQQFERIPVNYNHAKKEEVENDTHPKDDVPKNSPKTRTDEDTNDNQGTLDILVPEDHKYDEHLNIKFDDISIKLPEIKLPENILDYTYDEPSYKKKNKKQNKKSNKKPNKEKFFHYDEQDYNEDNPHDYEKGHEKDDHDHDRGEDYGYHYKGEKSSPYKSKQSHEEDDEEEDLYEKFVRERFGKKGSFEQRSEKLRAPGPAVENEQLFKTLQQVLKKTEDIEKESQKSGDPNAGYMWTLEYGQKL